MLDETITKIQDKLMTARHVTAKKMDFSISSRKEMQQTRADTMNSMNTFLLAIAAVSFASCGNKAADQAAKQADSIRIADSIAAAEAEAAAAAASDSTATPDSAATTTTTVAQ